MFCPFGHFLAFVLDADDNILGPVLDKSEKNLKHFLKF